MLPRKPKTNRFNWDLFDAQPLVVKQGTWEHNIYPDFPVDHEAAKAIARMMFQDVRKHAPRRDA